MGTSSLTTVAAPPPRRGIATLAPTSTGATAAYGSVVASAAPSPAKQNFMKLAFHGPILKLTKSVQNHNKEHMELKFRMKEVPNGNFSSFSLQRTKKSAFE